MKTFTRVVAVLMLVAVLSTLMVACGKPKNNIDDKLLGTWKQTDAQDGNWTWTFNKDGTCKFESDTNNFSSEGTYLIEEADSAKIKIKLDKWDKEKLFTYVATEKALQIQTFDESYFCQKQ